MRRRWHEERGGDGKGVSSWSKSSWSINYRKVTAWKTRRKLPWLVSRCHVKFVKVWCLIPRHTNRYFFGNIILHWFVINHGYFSILRTSIQRTLCLLILKKSNYHNYIHHCIISNRKLRKKCSTFQITFYYVLYHPIIFHSIKLFFTNTNISFKIIC